MTFLHSVTMAAKVGLIGLKLGGVYTAIYVPMRLAIWAVRRRMPE